MVQQEKQCLIEANNLKPKVKLYQYLLSLGKTEVFLIELNTHFSPIELGSRIGVLIEEGFISVDWKKKLITIESLTLKTALKKKDIIGEYNREIPEYMKGEKIEINKPYIDN